ncbi:MAG: exodeoxyribonuclease VII large subunit [Lachnospiraceae bacterium]|jgi:exodeoxyribonuclease VII large subunit|nr:exodeoxyribonuclease VII large subunit [Lachnospiraceae bacterium]
MANVFTVTQVNRYIKNMFASDYTLGRISVKGEVSNCKYHSSGHIYFTLKDPMGALGAVMFAGNRGGLKFVLAEGQQVVVTGNVDVYERDGKYQLYARTIELDGLGALYERFLKLKADLEEMGMFAPEYKQPIPRYALRVGVVTAPTGAAIQDIIQISRRRNPYVQLVLYPAQVQGEGAAKSVAAGIRRLDRMGLDVLIVGRGGGSIEDLWAFNEEAVARAIFECGTPVISAVGHETDVTIADYVADMRAPTPSAAAELAVFDLALYDREVAGMREALGMAARRKLEARREGLERRRYRLRLQDPAHQIRNKRQYLAQLAQRAQHLMARRLADAKHSLALQCSRLDGISPLKKLEKGFGYVSDGAGRKIASVAQVKVGERIRLRLTDGQLGAVVDEVERMERPAG